MRAKPKLGRIGGALSPSLVSGDELIGHVVEITADHLRLGAYSQDIIADPLDQRGLPASRDGAKRVSGVAGNETEL